MKYISLYTVVVLVGTVGTFSISFLPSLSEEVEEDSGSDEEYFINKFPEKWLHEEDSVSKILRGVLEKLFPS